MKIAVIFLLSWYSAGAVSRLGLDDWTKEFDSADVYDLNFSNVWNSWKISFNRAYKSSDEEDQRYNVWQSNLNNIIKHNSQLGTSYKLRLNQFGDLTNEEFSNYLHTGNLNFDDQHISNTTTHDHDDSQNIITDDATSYSYSSISSAPESIDWTNYNGKSYVTPVKNEGDCGASWALTATTTLECRCAIQTGHLYGLSEQQIIDCSDSYGNEGCNGGTTDNAFEYVLYDDGLCLEANYPYTQEPGICQANSCGSKYCGFSSIVNVPIDNSTAMMNAVATGCVAAAIDASSFAFQFYSSGIIDDNDCGTELDQAVVIVGYGSQSNGQEYWKIQNSWGNTWGMQGYALICRNCDKNGNEGECGILEDGSYPTKFENGSLVAGAN